MVKIKNINICSVHIKFVFFASPVHLVLGSGTAKLLGSNLTGPVFYWIGRYSVSKKLFAHYLPAYVCRPSCHRKIVYLLYTFYIAVALSVLIFLLFAILLALTLYIYFFAEKLYSAQMISAYFYVVSSLLFLSSFK